MRTIGCDWFSALRQHMNFSNPSIAVMAGSADADRMEAEPQQRNGGKTTKPAAKEALSRYMKSRSWTIAVR